MRTLRDLPIKQKLLVIIIVSTTAALLFSGIAIVAADSVSVPLAVAARPLIAGAPGRR